MKDALLTFTMHLDRKCWVKLTDIGLQQLNTYFTKNGKVGPIVQYWTTPCPDEHDYYMFALRELMNIFGPVAMHENLDCFVDGKIWMETP